MTTLKDVTMKNGRRRVTIELAPGEQLIRLRPDSFYRLAYPCDEVLPTHVLDSIRRVYWCPVEQNWIDA